MAALDVRLAQTTLENAVRDAILFALGFRLPSVATVAALRAVTTMAATSTLRSDDDLIQIVVGGVATASYRWNSESTTADDGVSTIKPTDVAANGRWLLWTSPLRMAPVVGGNGFFLNQLLAGPLRRVIVIDKSFTPEEVNALLSGSVPAVWIEATGDDPTEATLDAGHRWDTEFEFKISVLTENLRDRRQAAQGSVLSNESPLGANSIDGLIQSLLAGAQLQKVVGGLRDLRAGSARNLISDLGERRVVRERDYRVKVTVENPQAPNDLGTITEAASTPELVDLGQQPSLDLNNYVVDGIVVGPDIGLTQPIVAGSAVIAGASVAYAGSAGTAFPAYSDSYLDLLPNGTLVVVSVSGASDPPPITATALRVARVTTSGNSVIGCALIAARRKPFGSTPIHIQL